MTCKFKKISALFLTFALCLNIMAHMTFALSTTQQQIPATKGEVVAQLKEFGFTNKEIDELFEQFPYEGPQQKRHFLLARSSASHPDYTVVKEITAKSVELMGHTVNFGMIGLGMSSSAWAKVVIKSFGWKAVLIANEVALLLSTCYMGPNGIRISITYRWSYGDNSMTWQYLPIAFKATPY